MALDPSTIDIFNENVNIVYSKEVLRNKRYYKIIIT